MQKILLNLFIQERDTLKDLNMKPDMKNEKYFSH